MQFMKFKGLSPKIIVPLMAMIAVLFVMSPMSSCAETEITALVPMQQDEVKIRKSNGTEYLFHVEMAIEPAQHRQGLMFRESLADNAGMLFIFPREEKQVFWMRNTLIPLDMLFIRRDGTIDHIHHSAKPLDEARITSDGKALAVLELNGGTSDTYGIREGDKVIHEVFRNVLGP